MKVVFLFSFCSQNLQAKWILTLLTAAVVPLTIALGYWQLDRAQEKQFLMEALQQPELRVSSLDELPASTAGRRVLLTGRFLADRDVLLDNQPRQGRPGWALMTPFRLQHGGLVLTSRAWLPVTARRENFAEAVPPAAAELLGEIALRAEFRAIPSQRPALNQVGPGQAGWPKLVLQLQLPQIARWLDEPLADGIAWNLEPIGGHPPPAHPLAYMTVERHYGYALQWFALGLTWLVLYLLYLWRARSFSTREGR